jgi:hypothetical protein
MGGYALAALVVFGVNLMPAFGPPTWSVLVVLQVNLELEPALLVPIGATCATGGRVVLAKGSRLLRGRFSERRLASLDAVESELTRNRGRSLAGLGLFLVSPLPSAQLWIGAGILGAPLRPLAAAFFLGRLISYSFYVGIATVASDSLGGLTVDALRSPVGIALQVLMLIALVALVRVDWLKLLRRGQAEGPDPDAEPGRGPE